MSQQQFSYFDPEQETIYEPRLVNRDPRELQEYQEEQEETVYYVTPEQSMLRGEKLIPAQRTTSHLNWVATAIFLLMILFGTFVWAREVRPLHPSRHAIIDSRSGPPIWGNDKPHARDFQPDGGDGFHAGENGGP